MKSFKIKDLVISVEGAQNAINTDIIRANQKISPAICWVGCTFRLASTCGRYNSTIYQQQCWAGSINTIYTPDCGGTIKCGGSIDPTIFELRDIEMLEELKNAKEWIVEMEKTLEANFKPQTKEDLEMLEDKLSAAMNEVKLLKRQMK